MGLEDETRLSRYIMKSSHSGQRRESLLKLLISWELQHVESNKIGILILIVLWRNKNIANTVQWHQCHDWSCSNYSEKKSFWRVFLFLAGGNANFLWWPNSFRFQALQPSIFHPDANLPIIIIQNIQLYWVSPEKMTFWNCWSLFVVAHPAWWLTL